MTPEMMWLSGIGMIVVIALIWAAIVKQINAGSDEEHPGLELGPADELRPAPASSALTSSGWFTLALGVVAALFALSMDISAPGYDGIANMDAISRRAMVFEAGLALAVIGVVLATAGHVVTVMRSMKP